MTCAAQESRHRADVARRLAVPSLEALKQIGDVTNRLDHRRVKGRVLWGCVELAVLRSGSPVRREAHMRELTVLLRRELTVLRTGLKLRVEGTVLEAVRDIHRHSRSHLTALRLRTAEAGERLDSGELR